MLQLNYNEKCYTSAKIINENKMKYKYVFRKEEVKELINRIYLMPYGQKREEAVMTLECLLSGKKIVMNKGKIYLYFERTGAAPIEASYGPIVGNKELYALLEDLVQS